MMISKAVDSGPVITFGIDCRAPKRKVFETWTEPEWLKKWFFAEEGFRVTVAEVDLKVGGRYTLGMTPPDNAWENRMSGVYQVVRAPEALVYTWSVASQPDVPPTLVTVLFADRGTGSRLDLSHGVFVDAAVQKQHEDGWLGCLKQLGKLLEE